MNMTASALVDIDNTPSIASNDLRVRLEALPERARLGEEWESLEKQSASSFFQSWLWIGCWLECLPASVSVLLLRITAGERTVGLAIVGQRNITRHRVLHSRAWFLNETGVPAYDALTIEHNGILADRSVAPQVDIAVARFFQDRRQGWDEIYISGVVEQDAFALTPQAPITPKLIDAKPYFFVDLSELRAAKQSYLERLSSNTRSQVRQTLRSYERIGPLRLQLAADTAEAFRYLERLKELHTSYWIDKGRPGAFATPLQHDFHRRVVELGVAQGRIQLLKITAGEQEVGYLYNLVCGDTVCSYQSGFVYDETDAKRRPGLVSHYLAVEHNLAAALRIYDFLAGDARYKRSLSTHDGMMKWLAWQKPRLKFRIEKFAGEQKQRVLAWLAQRRSRAPKPG